MQFRLWGHFEFPLQAFFISDMGIITSPLPSGCEYEKILHSRKPLSAQGQGSEWLNCFIPGDCSYMSRLANHVADKPEHLHLQTGTLGASVPSPESHSARLPEGTEG